MQASTQKLQQVGEEETLGGISGDLDKVSTKSGNVTFVIYKDGVLYDTNEIN